MAEPRGRVRVATIIAATVAVAAAIAAAAAVVVAVLNWLTPARPAEPAAATLRQVHVIFRHGARTPTSLYPTDPNRPSDFPEGLGRVTKAGKRSMFALGRQLRQRYRFFLSGRPQEIGARSSGRDRCLESAQAMLASLCPPASADDRLDPQLDWQPVPVHTMPVHIDGMLYEDAPCKRDDELLQELRTTADGKRVMDEYADLFARLERASGRRMRDWVSVRDLLDTLTLERAAGLVVPAWATTNDTWRRMTTCARHTGRLNYRQAGRLRLRAGLLLGELVAHSDEVVESARLPTASPTPLIGARSDRKKIYVYSSHDVLVAALLSVFDVYNELPVPPSTTVLTELHEDAPGEFRIQMLLRNDTTTQRLIPLEVLGCQSNGCPWNVWRKKAVEFVPKNWEEECGVEPLRFPRYDVHY